MKTLRQFQVDAFSAQVFGGNPAAVVPLDAWLPDALLQAIAAENNLSETAFVVPTGARWALRWFTPVAEVDLCGHATLATAHVLFNHLGVDVPTLTFDTRSGPLEVQRRGDTLDMRFPALVPVPVQPPALLAEALGATPSAVLATDDYLAVFDDEATIHALAPDMGLLARLDRRGVIVTAPGREADFVSRFFVPKLGVPEDPVTGSAHCTLAPYWAARLGRDTLRGYQCSRRGGWVGCRMDGAWVVLSGEAVTFMDATLRVPV